MSAAQATAKTASVLETATAPIAHEVSALFGDLKKSVNGLATEDFRAIGEDLTQIVSDRIQKDPYMALLTGVGLGVGLSRLNRHHFTSAAIRVGKLLTMRALDSIDARAVGNEAGEINVEHDDKAGQSSVQSAVQSSSQSSGQGNQSAQPNHSDAKPTPGTTGQATQNRSSSTTPNSEAARG